jgi:hypothetical protein
LEILFFILVYKSISLSLLFFGLKKIMPGRLRTALPSAVNELAIGQFIDIAYNAQPEADAQYRAGRDRPWSRFMYRTRQSCLYYNTKIAAPEGVHYYVTPIFDTPDGKSPFFGAAGTGARVTRLS